MSRVNFHHSLMTHKRLFLSVVIWNLRGNGATRKPQCENIVDPINILPCDRSSFFSNKQFLRNDFRTSPWKFFNSSVKTIAIIFSSLVFTFVLHRCEQSKYIYRHASDEKLSINVLDICSLRMHCETERLQRKALRNISDSSLMAQPHVCLALCTLQASRRPSSVS